MTDFPPADAAQEPQAVDLDALAAQAGVDPAVLRDVDPAVVAALRENLGLGPAPNIEATVGAARSEPVDMGVTGVVNIEMASRSGPGGRVNLRVPGEHGIETYVAGPKPPAQFLIDAVEIVDDSRNMAKALPVLRRLIEAVLLPDDRDRYLARLSGWTKDAAGNDLEPISLPEMMTHAVRLLEVYMGRPLGGRSGSGAGGVAPGPTSTDGASPTV